MSADGRGQSTLSSTLSAMKERDAFKIATAVFHQLDHLRRLPVPPRYQPINPAFRDAVDAWRTGSALPDEHVPEFAAWLERTKARSETIGENERRLRTTTWAWRVLEGTDYDRHFEDFHAREWGVRSWPTDSAEREQQVQAVARNGKR